jgi:hypothetical protein
MHAYERHAYEMATYERHAYEMALLLQYSALLNRTA